MADEPKPVIDEANEVVTKVAINWKAYAIVALLVLGIATAAWFIIGRW